MVEIYFRSLLVGGMLEEGSWRIHGRGIMVEESWRRNHGRGIIEMEES